MNDRFSNFESKEKLCIILVLSEHLTFIHWLIPPTAMENPIDRTIRLMALAAGFVGLLVIVVFQFL